MRLFVFGTAAMRVGIQLFWMFVVLAPLGAGPPAVCAAGVNLPPESACAVYAQGLTAKMSELQTAGGDDAARLCREVATLYHEWLARSLAVNCTLGELDPQGRAAISRDLWDSLVRIRRPEALAYLVARIDQEHVVFDGDQPFVPPHY